MLLMIRDLYKVEHEAAEKIKQAYIAIYLKNFTIVELAQMRDFYKQFLGQAWAQKRAKVSEEILQISLRKTLETAPKVRQLIRELILRIEREEATSADWSFQPYINPRHGTLLNNGQTFTFKLDLPWTSRWRLFYLTGMEGGLGLSRRMTETDDLSVSGGLATRELVDVDVQTDVRTLTARLVWTAGIFYDRNGSLLVSCILGGGRGYIARLNLYPGIIDLAGLRIGGTLLFERNGAPGFGVTFAGFPLGVGL